MPDHSLVSFQQPLISLVDDPSQFGFGGFGGRRTFDLWPFDPITLQLFELVVLHSYSYNYYHIYLASASVLPGAVNELSRSKIFIDRESLSEHHGIGIHKLEARMGIVQVGPPEAVKSVK